jgi:hypothetical protein
MTLKTKSGVPVILMPTAWESPKHLKVILTACRGNPPGV